MRAFLTALVMIVALPFAGLADDRAERIEAARSFALTSGLWQAILSNIPDLGEVVVEGIRETRPDLRGDQARDIAALLNARFEAEQPAFLNTVSGVLANHLSTADLQALTAYFESQPGQIQARAIAHGNETSAEELTALILALPAEQQAAIEEFGNSAAARNWLSVQPRFIPEIEQVSESFGENLVYSSATEIQAILAR
ncbi:hypothetical protein AB6B38_08965 [Glycocaulis abyssi]|uniref:DUF2059 domain-containing protein n=1 Tax=Glycocaulis abyssi TaxID=1433403 RepID=A0ABV9NEX8_9PROT